ncbi:hypothetical protein KLEPA_00021 (plasmid) [Klebsiella pneumoniae]
MSVPLFSTRPFTPVIWTVFALYSNLDVAAPFSRTKDLSRDFYGTLVAGCRTVYKPQNQR